MDGAPKQWGSVFAGLCLSNSKVILGKGKISNFRPMTADVCYRRGGVFACVAARKFSIADCR